MNTIGSHTRTGAADRIALLEFGYCESHLKLCTRTIDSTEEKAWFVVDVCRRVPVSNHSRRAHRRRSSTTGGNVMRITRFKEPTALTIARRNRREIVAAQLTRREMIKFGLIGSTGYLVLKHGLSQWASGAAWAASGPGGGGTT